MYLYERGTGRLKGIIGLLPEGIYTLRETAFPSGEEYFCLV